MNLEEMMKNGAQIISGYRVEKNHYKIYEFSNRHYVVLDNELSRDFGGSHKRISCIREIEGKNYVLALNDELWGYYDKDGNVSDFYGGRHKYDMGFDRIEGKDYLLVNDGNGHCYIDKEGNKYQGMVQIVEDHFDKSFDFSAELIEASKILDMFMYDSELIDKVRAILKLKDSIEKQISYYDDAEKQRESVLSLLDSLKYQILHKPESFDLGGLK